MEALALPWVRDSAELPGPLPTHDQIENSRAVFPCIYGEEIRRTVLVNDHFVVKYGEFVFENEGHALWLVEKCPNVPAPRLYAMYRDNEKLYIVMEFVQGQPLSDIWPSLLENEKVKVAKELRQISDNLRTMASPGFYGGALHGPVPHRYFFSLEKNSSITGPFDSEAQFSQALALRSHDNWKSSGQRSWISDFFSRHLSSTLTGHNSVFTHADFQRKNILVRDEKISDCLVSAPHRNLRVVAILDWESAGWYPTYWAFASSFASSDWSDDWVEKVEMIFRPHVKEAAVLKVIALDLDA